MKMTQIAHYGGYLCKALDARVRVQLRCLRGMRKELRFEKNNPLRRSVFKMYSMTCALWERETRKVASWKRLIDATKYSRSKAVGACPAPSTK